MARLVPFFLLFLLTGVCRAEPAPCTALVRLVDASGLSPVERAMVFELLTVRGQNRHFERAIEEAHWWYPSDPKARGIFLYNLLGKNGGSRIVPVDDLGRPSFLGNRYDSVLSVEFNEALNTAVFRTKRWLPEEADAIVLALHGQGGLPSHSRSWFQPAQLLSRVSDMALSSPSHTAVALRKTLPAGVTPPKLHMVAIDQPGHGTGPKADHYMGMEQFLEWLDQAITLAWEPGKPLIIMARSASPPLVRELMSRRERAGSPLPIVAMIEIGPVYPSPQEEEHDLQQFLEEALTATNALDREVNWPGWTMTRSLNMQMTWLDAPATRIPTLTLVGSGDGVVSATARAGFQSLAALHPLSRYTEIPGGHDPLSFVRRGNRVETAYLDGYRTILEFIDSALKPMPN